jgi:hypothetical protein
MTATDPSRPIPIIEEQAGQAARPQAAGAAVLKAFPKREDALLSRLHLPKVTTTLDEFDAASAGGD